MSLALDRATTEVANALEDIAKDLRRARIAGITPEAANERAARRAERLAEKLRLAVLHANELLERHV
jgi:hypothetical protein